MDNLSLERLENSGRGPRVFWTIKRGDIRLFSKSDNSFTCWTRKKDATYYLERIKIIGLEAVDRELGFIRENNAEKFIKGI